MESKTIKSFENLFPDNAQLRLANAVAHTAMNAETKRDVPAHIGPVDNKLVGLFKDVLIAISRSVPHGQLVTLLYQFAAQLHIPGRRPAHVGQRCLVADNFRYRAGDKRRIVLDLLQL